MGRSEWGKALEVLLPLILTDGCCVCGTCRPMWTRFDNDNETLLALTSIALMGHGNRGLKKSIAGSLRSPWHRWCLFLQRHFTQGIFFLGLSLTPLSLQVEHCPSRVGMLAFTAFSLRGCSLLYCFSQPIPLRQSFSMRQWKER